MPIVEKHEPGSFCWAELATTDPKAAKSFYGALLGWEAKDNSMGEGGFYTIFRVRAQDAAGMYGLTKEQRDQGTPPHWLLYFTVDSADRSAQKARELGAKVAAGPFDVPGIGRMAVVEDPGGAKFALWQPMGYQGAKIVYEAGTPMWPELNTRDTAQAQSFYGGLLGWVAKKSDLPMAYTEWRLGGQSIGGMIQMDASWGEAPPHWMIYMLVPDCDAAAAKAAELGGTLCVPPSDIPKVGRFAVLGDPQGAYFSIIQLNAMG